MLLTAEGTIRPRLRNSGTGIRRYCMKLEKRLMELTEKMYEKNIAECSDAQLYNCVLQLTKEEMADKPVIPGGKKV